MRRSCPCAPVLGLCLHCIFGFLVAAVVEDNETLYGSFKLIILSALQQQSIIASVTVDVTVRDIKGSNLRTLLNFTEMNQVLHYWEYK